MKKKRQSIHKGMAGIQRKIKKEQGFFDGRFNTRSVADKTKYTRKTKHKK